MARPPGPQPIGSRYRALPTEPEPQGDVLIVYRDDTPNELFEDAFGIDNNEHLVVVEMKDRKHLIPMDVIRQVTIVPRKDS